MRAFLSRKTLLSGQSAESAAKQGQAQFAKTKTQAIGMGEELLQGLFHNLRQGTREDLAAILEVFPFYVDVVATANAAIEKSAPPAPPLGRSEAEPASSEYLASSMFLARCFAYLTSQPHGYERLHLVTGQKLSAKQRTLEQMSKVALDEQSDVVAVANQEALSEALSEMDAWGHALHGLFHSHPGSGERATRPSSTDLTTHERYERGGIPLVGCIFVHDGTFRFFRHSSEPFSIKISGTGIVPINEDDHVYKIQNPTAHFVSYETFETDAHG